MGLLLDNLKHKLTKRSRGFKVVLTLGTIIVLVLLVFGGWFAFNKFQNWQESQRLLVLAKAYNDKQQKTVQEIWAKYKSPEVVKCLQSSYGLAALAASLEGKQNEYKIVGIKGVEASKELNSYNDLYNRLKSISNSLYDRFYIFAPSEPELPSVYISTDYDPPSQRNYDNAALTATRYLNFWIDKITRNDKPDSVPKEYIYCPDTSQITISYPLNENACIEVSKAAIYSNILSNFPSDDYNNPAFRELINTKLKSGIEKSLAREIACCRGIPSTECLTWSKSWTSGVATYPTYNL